MLNLKEFKENNLKTLERISGGHLLHWSTTKPPKGVSHEVMNFQEWTKKMKEVNGGDLWGTSVPASYDGDLYWSFD